MQRKKFRNTLTQIALPTFTIVSYIVIGLKYPGRWLVVNLAAQPFRFYSSWKAYKEAGQIGMLITTAIITIVLIFGIINYWVI